MQQVCMSSFNIHSSPDVDTDSCQQKPNVILFYNKNEVVLDCFDQMTRFYTARSASRRWTLFVWENILDIAAINGKILFVKCTRNCISRRQYIEIYVMSRNQQGPVRLHLLSLLLRLPRSQKKKMSR